MSQALKALFTTLRPFYTPKILPVLKMGHPKLIIPTLHVKDFDAPEIKNAVSDMIYTAETTLTDRIGIAGNQLGVPYNVFLFRVPKEPVNPRYQSIWNPKNIYPNWTVVFNPEITPISNEMSEEYEPCASLPGIKVLVPRYKSVKMTFQSADGSTKTLCDEDLVARLWQHETDHTKGILAIHRVKNMSNVVFEDPELIKSMIGLHFIEDQKHSQMDTPVTSLAGDHHDCQVHDYMGG